MGSCQEVCTPKRGNVLTSPAALPAAGQQAAADAAHVRRVPRAERDGRAARQAGTCMRACMRACVRVHGSVRACVMLGWEATCSGLILRSSAPLTPPPVTARLAPCCPTSMPPPLTARPAHSLPTLDLSRFGIGSLGAHSCLPRSFKTLSHLRASSLFQDSVVTLARSPARLTGRPRTHGRATAAGVARPCTTRAAKAMRSACARCSTT